MLVARFNNRFMMIRLVLKKNDLSLFHRAIHYIMTIELKNIGPF